MARVLVNHPWGTLVKLSHKLNKQVDCISKKTKWIKSLKHKCRHCDEHLVSDCTGCCHLKNFQCSYCRKVRQNVGINVLVIVCIWYVFPNFSTEASSNVKALRQFNMPMSTLTGYSHAPACIFISNGELNKSRHSWQVTYSITCAWHSTYPHFQGCQWSGKIREKIQCHGKVLELREKSGKYLDAGNLGKIREFCDEWP